MACLRPAIINRPVWKQKILTTGIDSTADDPHGGEKCGKDREHLSVNVRSSCPQIRRTILCLSLLTISACSQDVSDLQTFIAQTKSAHVGSVKAIPQFKPYESFSYSAAELRDPFVATADLDKDESTKTSLLNPDSTRPKQPLEVYPLDTLRMVGILEQNEQLWGLIKDPQNIVHRVQVGNYMGQSEGRITDINDSAIYLVEIVPDGIGGYIERDASIAIGGQ
jgi:type IV pilus assembly protein PilP